MRTTVLTLILGWACAWAWSALAQTGESERADLRQVVVDLSDDEFGNRERATRLLWESGDRALVAEIVAHGATAEARSRAAQVLTSFQWGILPGVTPIVRAQIDQLRSGSLTEKRVAMTELMQTGHLQVAAGGLLLTSDPVHRDQLHQQLRSMMGVIVPRELAAGREGEVRALLQALAPEWSAYARDLQALEYQPEPPPDSSRVRVDGDTPQWVLSLQSDDHLEKLWHRRVAGPGPESAVFDLLMHQQRLTEAIEALRRILQVEEEISATEVLRRYLALEVAKVKTQNYSKKALGLSHDMDFQPTSFDLSDGARAVLRFCHEYGLAELIQEAGQLAAARTMSIAPTALPTFCVWASSYPELREMAIETAITASGNGIPPEFAIAPMCNPYSRQGRWFAQFISLPEKRGLLLHDVRNGGWGALGMLKDDEDRRLSAARGYAAMATGAWEDAALSFEQAVSDSGTLAEASVFGYLISVSYARAGHLASSKQWHRIAEATALADEEARSALADTMQRYGDLDGAVLNRRRLIDLHVPDGHTGYLLHALRLVARSLDLSDPNGLSLATAVSTQLLAAIESPDGHQIDSGEVAWDAAFYHQCRMLMALRDKRSDIATMELLAAHQCAPGALEVFETLISLSASGGRDLLPAAKVHLARAANIWVQAATAFPENAAIGRKISRCRVLGERLAAAVESDR